MPYFIYKYNHFVRTWIVLNVKTEWFYDETESLFSVTKDLGLFRSFKMTDSIMDQYGHGPFILLTIPIPTIALVIFILMMLNIYRTYQMRKRTIDRTGSSGSSASSKSAGGKLTIFTEKILCWK